MAELLARGLAAPDLEVLRPHIEELHDQGFTVIPDMLSSEQLHSLRSQFEAILAEEGLREGERQSFESMDGVRRINDLVNKGEEFEAIWCNPILHAMVASVLTEPFRLHSLNGHDPLPGRGHQALHADWRPAVMDEPADVNAKPTPASGFGVVNSIWMLDDWKKNTGATRLVPRSHHDPPLVDAVLKMGPPLGSSNGDNLGGPAEEYAMQVEAPAGSVCVFNGSVWHAASQNNSADEKRRACHCAWIDRRWPQQTNQKEHLTEDTAKRLSPLDRWLLDVGDKWS
jgi:ectoine hydroxylase-related dioxygenase (phytanoyl-CoA dioxygenase family)